MDRIICLYTARKDAPRNPRAAYECKWCARLKSCPMARTYEPKTTKTKGEN